jgi:hypothetical protein
MEHPKYNRLSRRLYLYCVFRTIPAGDFGAFRPAVSLDSGHLFRSIPAGYGWDDAMS